MGRKRIIQEAWITSDQVVSHLQLVECYNLYFQFWNGFGGRGVRLLIEDGYER